MKEPVLSPRSYVIEHDYNEYTYFVVLLTLDAGTYWTIKLSNTQDYMTLDRVFDLPSSDTATFDTPELALEFWKDYCRSTRRSLIDDGTGFRIERST